MLLKKFDISLEKNTKIIAEKLYEISRAGDAFALTGQLGTGKTSFARYFIQKGCKGERVPSPSYNIYYQYQCSKSSIIHLDAWRFVKEEEFLNLGISDFLKSSIFIVEWANKIENYLPNNSLKIFFDIIENRRFLSFFGEKSWKNRIKSIVDDKKII